MQSLNPLHANLAIAKVLESVKKQRRIIQIDKDTKTYTVTIGGTAYCSLNQTNLQLFQVVLNTKSQESFRSLRTAISSPVTSPTRRARMQFALSIKILAWRLAISPLRPIMCRTSLLQSLCPPAISSRSSISTPIPTSRDCNNISSS